MSGRATERKGSLVWGLKLCEKDRMYSYPAPGPSESASLSVHTAKDNSSLRVGTRCRGGHRHDTHVQCTYVAPFPVCGFPPWQSVPQPDTLFGLFKEWLPGICRGSICWVLRLTHQIQWQGETGEGSRPPFYLVSCCDIHTVPHPGKGVGTVVSPGLNPGTLPASVSSCIHFLAS